VNAHLDGVDAGPGANDDGAWGFFFFFPFLLCSLLPFLSLVFACGAHKPERGRQLLDRDMKLVRTRSDNRMCILPSHKVRKKRLEIIRIWRAMVPVDNIIPSFTPTQPRLGYGGHAGGCPSDGGARCAA
jgi:hypothetical protein